MGEQLASSAARDDVAVVVVTEERNTFLEPLAGRDDIQDFLMHYYKSPWFADAARKEELLATNKTLNELFQQLVVQEKKLTEEDFWQRYYYHHAFHNKDKNKENGDSTSTTLPGDHSEEDEEVPPKRLSHATKSTMELLEFAHKRATICVPKKFNINDGQLEDESATDRSEDNTNYAWDVVKSRNQKRTTMWQQQQRQSALINDGDEKEDYGLGISGRGTMVDLSNNRGTARPEMESTIALLQEASERTSMMVPVRTTRRRDGTRTSQAPAPSSLLGGASMEDISMLSDYYSNYSTTDDDESSRMSNNGADIDVSDLLQAARRRTSTIPPPNIPLSSLLADGDDEEDTSHYSESEYDDAFNTTIDSEHNTTGLKSIGEEDGEADNPLLLSGDEIMRNDVTKGDTSTKEEKKDGGEDFHESATTFSVLEKMELETGEAVLTPSQSAVAKEEEEEKDRLEEDKIADTTKSADVISTKQPAVGDDDAITTQIISGFFQNFGEGMSQLATAAAAAAVAQGEEEETTTKDKGEPVKEKEGKIEKLTEERNEMTQLPNTLEEAAYWGWQLWDALVQDITDPISEQPLEPEPEEPVSSRVLLEQNNNNKDGGNLASCLDGFSAAGSWLQPSDFHLELPIRVSEDLAARIRQVAAILRKNTSVTTVTVLVPNNMDEEDWLNPAGLLQLFDVIGGLQSLEHLKILAAAVPASTSRCATTTTQQEEHQQRSRIATSLITQTLQGIIVQNKNHWERGLTSLSIKGIVLVDNTEEDMGNFVQAMSAIRSIGDHTQVDIDVQYDGSM